MGVVAAPLGVDVEGVDAAAAAAFEVVDVVAVVPLVVVELLLPQPASNTPQTSAPASSGDRVAIIGPPCIESAPTRSRAAGEGRRVAQG
jgi:hypothetical protein